MSSFIPSQHIISVLFTSFVVGMFSEAYLVFSVGNIGSFQKAAFPDCYKTYAVCPHDMITQKIDSYVQIIGIIIGMMLMGLMGKNESLPTYLPMRFSPLNLSLFLTWSFHIGN